MAVADVITPPCRFLALFLKLCRHLAPKQAAQDWSADLGSSPDRGSFDHAPAAK
jgi:hypothetical protein